MGGMLNRLYNGRMVVWKVLIERFFGVLVDEVMIFGLEKWIFIWVFENGVSKVSGRRK